MSEAPESPCLEDRQLFNSEDEMRDVHSTEHAKDMQDLDAASSHEEESMPSLHGLRKMPLQVLDVFRDIPRFQVNKNSKVSFPLF